MKNLFCLSDEAISVLKMPTVKWKVMHALEIIDVRTVDKHLQNNFPNGPLLNFNVREIIRANSLYLSDKEIYRKLTEADFIRIRGKRMEIQAQNAKYNNSKNNDHD